MQGTKTSWAGSESPGPITYTADGTIGFLTKDSVGDTSADWTFITHINPMVVDRDDCVRIVWDWQSPSAFHALTFRISTTPISFYFQKNSTVLNTNTIATYTAGSGGGTTNIAIRIKKVGSTYTIGIDLAGGSSFTDVITSTDASYSHGYVGYAADNTWDTSAQCSVYFVSFATASSSLGAFADYHLRRQRQ